MSVFRLLKRHFHNNRLLTLIFIICQICSVLAFCFLFLYTSSVQNHNSGNYTAVVNLGSNVTRQEILNKFSELSAEHSDKIERIYCLSSIKNEDPVKVNIFYKNIDEKFLMAGRFFDSKESNRAVPYCIANASHASLKVGDSVEIYGVEHQVIGISMYEYWELDKQSFQYITEPQNIEIIFSKDVNKKDIELCAAKIYQSFTNSQISIYQERLSFFECLSISEYVLFFMIIFIININFAGIFMYIIKEDNDIVKTFMILGCPLKTVLRKTIAEIVILCILSFTVGIAVFQSSIAPLISIANANFVSHLPWIDLWIIAIFYLTCVLILFTPLVYQYYKSNFYRQNEKGEVL